MSVQKLTRCEPLACAHERHGNGNGVTAAKEGSLEFANPESQPSARPKPPNVTFSKCSSQPRFAQSRGDSEAA